MRRATWRQRVAGWWAGFLWLLAWHRKPEETSHPAPEEPRKPMRCKPDARTSKETLDALFGRLQAVMAIGPYHSSMHGYYQIGLAAMANRLGVYIHAGDLNEFPDRVEHMGRLPLPAMLSVSLLDPTLTCKIGRHRVQLAKFAAALMKTPLPRIERVRGSYYECALSFVQWQRAKRFGGTQKGVTRHLHFFAVVECNGSVRILREDGRRASAVNFIATGTGASDPGTVERELAADVARYINLFRLRDMNWLVRVQHPRKRLRATFGIPPAAAPTMFRDRIKGDDGRATRIFHPVRPHERVTSRGVSKVRLHHRGAREFVWRGYRCLIQIPGMHSMAVNEFTLPAATGRPEATMAEAREVAEMLVSHDREPRRSAR